MNCNVCGNEVPQFISRLRFDGTTSLDCPICQSYQRHRALVKGFSALWAQDIRLLHIGPYSATVKYFWRTVEGRPGFSYIPVDVRPREFGVINLDISRVALKIAPSDVVICKHVLEYVVNDVQAMENITESTKSGGKLILDVPLKSGVTDRPNVMPKEAERITRFGQADHLRYYGEDDILGWVSVFGFTVDFQKINADASIGLDVPYWFIVGQKI